MAPGPGPSSWAPKPLVNTTFSGAWERCRSRQASKPVGLQMSKHAGRQAGRQANRQAVLTCRFFVQTSAAAAAAAFTAALAAAGTAGLVSCRWHRLACAAV